MPQVAVYGIISYINNASKTVQAVAQVSPVVNPVAALNDAIDPGTQTALAACSDKASRSFVYFLKYAWRLASPVANKDYEN